MPKVTLTKTFDADVHFIEVEAAVRYWEDASVNDEMDDSGTLIPLRKGASWCPVINLETGRVLDWPLGTTADIHYKVCDAGLYWLLDVERRRVAMKNGYVPDFLSVNDSGWGDYIIMSIGSDGVISGWAPPILENDEWEAV